MAIVKTFGSDQFLRLLTEATADSPIVLRTLGLIRNVLSHGNVHFVAFNFSPLIVFFQDPKAYTHNHIDEVMVVHGNSIIQAVIYVLEDQYSSDAKASPIPYFSADNCDILGNGPVHFVEHCCRCQRQRVYCRQ